MDTIFAPATAQGRSGICVIRISGPRAHAIGEKLCGALPHPRKTAVRDLSGGDGNVLDQALVLCFLGPASFTGEDVVELHLHGSVAVVSSVLRELSAQEGARLADPGEFTRRALENGQLDLAQVEGLADLIDAETEAQRKQALRVLSGALGDVVEKWRANLIRAAALLEATMDFADDEVPVDVTPEVSMLLSSVTETLQGEIAGTFVAERVRAGFEVAIVGPPNAGKSTLLNRLAGRDAAITSEIAGTTRDVIEVRMDLGGLPVTVLDTAGLRDSHDVVESIGIERAVQRARDADLRVFLKNENEDLPLSPLKDDIVLRPKMDVLKGSRGGISGKTGAGVQALIDRVKSVFADRVTTAGVATHARHRDAMERALKCLNAASAILANGPASYDIAAEELRTAIRALEALVGRIDAENLLDEIFASFCLGK